MKYYKGLNSDMTCKDKVGKYERYEEYHHGGMIYVHEEGYHACEKPLDTFKYNPPATSVFYRAELGDRIAHNTRQNDTLVASNEIILEKKLSLKDIMLAEKKYAEKEDKLFHGQVRGNLNNIFIDDTREYQTLRVGNSGAIYTGSHNRAIAGDNSLIYSYSDLAYAGKNSIARTERYGISVVGKGGVAISDSDGISIARGAGAAAVAGNDGVVIGTKYSRVGESGVIIIMDFGDDDIYVMAGLNSVIVFTLTNKTKTLTIDGEKYKADTLYKVIFKNGNYTLEEEKDKSILETFAFTVDIK